MQKPDVRIEPVGSLFFGHLNKIYRDCDRDRDHDVTKWSPNSSAVHASSWSSLRCKRPSVASAHWPAHDRDRDRVTVTVTMIWSRFRCKASMCGPQDFSTMQHQCEFHVRGICVCVHTYMEVRVCVPMYVVLSHRHTDSKLYIYVLVQHNMSVEFYVRGIRVYVHTYMEVRVCGSM